MMQEVHLLVLQPLKSMAGSYVRPAEKAHMTRTSTTLKALAITAIIALSGDTLHAQSFNALDMDGANDYVSLSSSTPVPIGNSNYTIEAWIKPTTMGTCGIIGWGPWGSGNQVNALRLFSGGFLNYWWGNDIGASTSNLAGAWHHVAATFNGTTRCLYLDGALVASDLPGSGHAVPSASNLCIGRTNNNEYFPGSIDEVRVWNRALCQAELQNNMNGELPSPTTQSGLVAYYKGNQGTAGSNNTGVNTLTDASASGYNGTLNNFALSGSGSNWVAGATSIAGDVTQGTIPSSITESLTKTISGTTAFSGCGAMSAITPTGTTNALSGSVNTRVTLDASVNTFSGQAYVQRHYDIEPVTNAATATANITLYYTQADFTAFNAARGLLPALPVDATDAANNKANLRITQCHGVPTGGYAPSNYPLTWGGSGPARVLLTPSSVSWNSAASRWEAVVSITGFSGFFASTTTTPLPVDLISFTATAKGSQVQLAWLLAKPGDGKEYIVERSRDARHFDAIGRVAASNLFDYNYTDMQPLQGKSYYRLRMVELGGTESYTHTATVVLNTDSYLHAYPSPASDRLIIETADRTAINGHLYDLQGRMALPVNIRSGEPVDISNIPGGVYILRAGTQSIRIVKR
jgi:hypothetical protein